MKAAEVGEITQNNGHYAVQGHSRSPILVLIEYPYATLYQWLIDTNLPTIFHRFQVVIDYISEFR